MKVISSVDLIEESNSSATFTIVIDDFQKKLAEATVGIKSDEEEVYVNWTKLNLVLFIADRKGRGVGIFFQNRSDRMVRARYEISVQVKMDHLFEGIKLY